MPLTGDRCVKSTVVVVVLGGVVVVVGAMVVVVVVVVVVASDVVVGSASLGEQAARTSPSATSQESVARTRRWYVGVRPIHRQCRAEGRREAPPRDQPYAAHLKP